MAHRTVDYAQGRLLPMILKFSLPAAVATLVNSLYTSINMIFVGQYAGNTALSGVSVCIPISFIAIAFAMTCSAGGATMFSLLRGGGDEDHAEHAFGSALRLVVVLELLATLLMQVFAGPILTLFGVTQTNYSHALDYYRIITMGCVFVGMSSVFCDFIRVAGRPMLGMGTVLMGAVVNVALDWVLVARLGMGVRGAALATLCGQIAATALGAAIVFSGKTVVRTGGGAFVMDRRMNRKILECGSAFFITQISMAFLSLVYNNRLGELGGDVAISVYAVISSMMTFVIMPASGLSQGLQPILGYNAGAGRDDRVIRAMKLATAVSVGVTAVIWLAIQLFPEQILLLFSSDATEEMLSIGVSALRLNYAVTPILGFVILATTFFQAIGRPAPSILLTLLRQVIVLVPLLFILPAFFGLSGVFLAQPVSDLCALVVAWVLIRRTFFTIQTTTMLRKDHEFV